MTVPYLRLVVSNGSPGGHAAWFGFSARDLMALNAWRRDAWQHGYQRVLVEMGSVEMGPEEGSYALIYVPGRVWAAWGIARSGTELVVWHCGTGRDAGRFASMEAALHSLPAVARDGAAPEPVIARRIGGLPPRRSPPPVRNS